MCYVIKDCYFLLLIDLIRPLIILLINTIVSRNASISSVVIRPRLHEK
jgi:hypothetical protein